MSEGKIICVMFVSFLIGFSILLEDKEGTNSDIVELICYILMLIPLLYFIFNVL